MNIRIVQDIGTSVRAPLLPIGPMTHPATARSLPDVAVKAVAITYGVVCHVFFALGVGSMIAMMFFGMSRSFGRLEAPWSFVVNLALLLQFPLTHSGLLSRHGAKLLGSLAPRPISKNLATTTYATIASVQVALLFLGWSPSGEIWWEAEGFPLACLVILYVASWLLLLKAIVDAGFAQQVGLLGWWAVYRKIPVVYPPMPQHGLFRLSRQPIYVAFVMTLWTVPVWTPDQLEVALVLSLYCLIGPLFKERRFARRFGDQFRDYQRRVPYWLPVLRASTSRQVGQPLKNDLSLYERHADDWWSGRTRWLRTLHKMAPARLRMIDPIVGDWVNKDVLDLGCGGGFLAEEMAQRGARVVGVDPSKGAIAAGVDHARRSGLRINYLVGIGESIPLADGSCDVVACVDVLEHVADLPRVLAEVRRVLRPRGIFVFDTINRNWLAKLVIITLGERVLRLLPSGTHDPDLFIKPSELSDALTAAGFEVGPMEGFGPRGVDRNLDLLFGPHLLTSIMYLGHARVR